MARVRQRHTAPELMLRRELFARGFRFRLHVRELPGTPDIVLSKWSAVVFVNGCFWHRHNCKRFNWPKSNSEFWRRKISRNVERDEKSISALLALGWRVAVVWQCEIGQKSIDKAQVVDRLDRWLRSASNLGPERFSAT
ncbi:DNA mismatch endonuclease Vsr [Mesorhizobium sp. WSM4303]|nr:DNA mismatch endonuclease Vsr [Mesorhizobium sp. WSM4303]